MTDAAGSPAASRDIVLVVDDSPETLGFLTKALETSGVTVLVATSGTAALAICDRITPDMVLMDAVMPAPDGFETCRLLKARRGLEHVPVIFMTGLSETEHVVHALESGGVDFLTKPINLDELQARIRVHLANARQVQSARIALDAAGRHLIAVGADGSIKWSTPQASQVLEALGRGNVAAGEIALDHIRTALAGWIAAASRQATGRPDPQVLDLGAAGQYEFAPIGSISADEHLFRLTSASHPGQTDALRQRFGLTPREADVLTWISRGKSNKDIGDILGLSPRTVNKHLEQIYAKLGVENRASAAVRASEVLRDL